MKIVKYKDVVNIVSEICIEASCNLPNDVYSAIKEGIEVEKSPLGSAILADCIKNADIAKKHQSPICQDTGFAVFFVEVGENVKIDGGTISQAITEGAVKGYKEGFLRKSIVVDPIFNRVNTGDNTPVIIHLDNVPGDEIKITIAPKGGGSENMSAIAMLKPSQGQKGVIDFVVDSVVNAGGNPCPPVVVGVGVGGTFEKAAYLAKKSLLRDLGEHNSDANYAELEREILEKINNSGVGPQGLGGSLTALVVNIDFYPCHIASLPVAVNLNCHAARHVEVVI